MSLTLPFTDVYLFAKNHNNSAIDSGSIADQRILQFDWLTVIPFHIYLHGSLSFFYSWMLTFFVKNQVDPAIEQGVIAYERNLNSD